MNYKLLIGDYAYSSWSLRGWLLFEAFGIDVETQIVDFHVGEVKDQLAAFAPARTVPTLITPEGAIVSESLAIAEELASRHPQAGHWPPGPKARAIARSITSEMHAGFVALRTACPMALRAAYRGVETAADVDADLRRLEVIWDYARAQTGAQRAWLCGDYSVADVFYAPVAARIAGYGLRVSPSAQEYVGAHLNHPSFRRWRAMGLVKGATLKRYARDHQTTVWPGPKPLAAKAVEAGPSENADCPYSGRPVTDFLKIGGRRFGFCNPFCRDKTVADPEAWPAFMKIYAPNGTT